MGYSGTLGRRSNRSRARRPAWRVSLGELRLVMLAGVMIGLVAPIADQFGSAELSVRVPWRVPSSGGEGASARRFSLCFTGGGTNCVVDGDTFWIDGEKVRIADIDTPETHPPRCAEEARLGAAATDRLRTLLDAGPVTLVPIDRVMDRYGRKLRVVERDGVSLGDTLIAEGLARPWEGRRRPWCSA